MTKRSLKGRIERLERQANLGGRPIAKISGCHVQPQQPAAPEFEVTIEEAPHYELLDLVPAEEVNRAGERWAALTKQLWDGVRPSEAEQRELSELENRFGFRFEFGVQGGAIESQYDNSCQEREADQRWLEALEAGVVQPRCAEDGLAKRQRRRKCRG